MEYKDYYATLGIPKTASQAEVKKAFRKLAREHHPDVNKGDAAAERRFKDVNEAHAVLGDPEKRKAYDELGANWEAYQRAGAGARAGSPFGGFGGYRTSGAGPGGIRFEYHGNAEDLAGFSDFFRTFFGAGVDGAAGNGRGTRTSRTSRTTTGGIDLDDLLSGLGGDDRDQYDRFSAGRRGATPTPARDAEADVEISLDEAFEGTKRLVQLGDRRLEVTIPPGVDTGHRIRFAGKRSDRQAPPGDASAGDLYLNVTVRPHHVFERTGADLHRELPITLGEALLGGEVPVATLTGRVLLRLPPGTQNGRTFRLAGQGMPRFRGQGRGDLYVRVRVVLPGDLDDRGHRLARELVDHVKQPDPRHGA